MSAEQFYKGETIRLAKELEELEHIQMSYGFVRAMYDAEKEQKEKNTNV